MRKIHEKLSTSKCSNVIREGKQCEDVMFRKWTGYWKSEIHLGSGDQSYFRWPRDKIIKFFFNFGLYDLWIYARQVSWNFFSFKVVYYPKPSVRYLLGLFEVLFTSGGSIWFVHWLILRELREDSNTNWYILCFRCIMMISKPKVSNWRKSNFNHVWFQKRKWRFLLRLQYLSPAQVSKHLRKWCNEYFCI